MGFRGRVSIDGDCRTALLANTTGRFIQTVLRGAINSAAPFRTTAALT